MWTSTQTQLILRFVKHRWLPDCVELLAQTLPEDPDAPLGDLAFEDFDLDKDMLQLLDTAGLRALKQLCLALLQREAPLADDPTCARVLEALAPELEGDAAQAFTTLVAANLAFRLRDDASLQALIAHTRRGPTPRLAPHTLANLLARARPLTTARAWLTAAGAQAAVDALAEPELELWGARIHVEVPQPSLDVALERALAPDFTPLSFQLAPPGTRQFLSLKTRGGFTTLLEEGEEVGEDLAKSLAQVKGTGRVAWADFGPPEDPPRAPRLRILDGTRTLESTDTLAKRLGREPTAADVAGTLRALGVLDLDPEHPRGAAPLTYFRARSQKPKGYHLIAFAPAPS